VEELDERREALYKGPILFNGDVCSSKGKVPELLLTAQWRGQPFLDAAVC
jgi:hypothetical protein